MKRTNGKPGKNKVEKVSAKERFDANMSGIKALLNNAQECADKGQYINAAKALRHARLLCIDAKKKLSLMKKTVPSLRKILNTFFGFGKRRDSGKVVKMNDKSKPGMAS